MSAANNGGRRISAELRAGIIAMAADADCLGDIARAMRCGDWTVRHVLDQHDPDLAPAIARRGVSRRSESNRRQAEALNAARAEERAQAARREAEAARPACRRATPALWALRNRAGAFVSLGVQGAPETEAEARMAIGLAGDRRTIRGRPCGDLAVHMAIRLAGGAA